MGFLFQQIHKMYWTIIQTEVTFSNGNRRLSSPSKSLPGKFHLEIAQCKIHNPILITEIAFIIMKAIDFIQQFFPRISSMTLFQNYCALLLKILQHLSFFFCHKMKVGCSEQLFTNIKVAVSFLVSFCNPTSLLHCMPFLMGYMKIPIEHWYLLARKYKALKTYIPSHLQNSLNMMEDRFSYWGNSEVEATNMLALLESCMKQARELSLKAHGSEPLRANTISPPITYSKTSRFLSRQH